MSPLQSLLDQRQLWRARDAGAAGADVLATGWLRLDRELYGAGWPMAGISELLCAEPVLAWQLLQPALVRLSQQLRLLVWIGHERAPYLPAWLRAGLNAGRCLLVRANDEEAPWAAEQALRLAHGGAVLLQANKLNADRLRRLQLAAQSGNSFLFLLRPLSAQRQTSPAALRLAIQPAKAGLQVALLKRRGGAALAPFVVPLLPAMSSPSAMPVAPVMSVAPAMPALSGVGMPLQSALLRHSEHTVSQQALTTAAVGVVGQKTVALAITGNNNLASSNHATGNEQVAANRSVWDKQASVTLPPRMAASFLFGASMPITASRAANAQHHTQTFNKAPITVASEPAPARSTELMLASEAESITDSADAHAVTGVHAS